MAYLWNVDNKKKEMNHVIDLRDVPAKESERKVKLGAVTRPSDEDRERVLIRAQIHEAVNEVRECESQLSHFFPDDALIDKDIEFFDGPRAVIKKVALSFRVFVSSPASRLARKMIFDAILLETNKRKRLAKFNYYKKYLSQLSSCFPTRVYSFLDTVVEVLAEKRYEGRYHKALLLTILQNLKEVVGNEQVLFITSSLINKLFEHKLLDKEYFEEWLVVKEAILAYPGRGETNEIDSLEDHLRDLEDIERDVKSFIELMIIHVESNDYVTEL